MALDWNIIQEKWQKAWETAQIGRASVRKEKEKFMMIFAYPGISGFLHVGHMRGFSYTDAICRFERLQGKEVLFPVGTHASGNQAIAFANKVKNKDKTWLEYLQRNGCPSEKIKQLIEPSKVIEYFNDVYVNQYWKKFGFLADWERFTCTTFPDYEKFIQWQFRKLKQKDLLVQKPYFATACIKDGPVAVDPSETDISKGGNAEKNEYTLLKFKLGKEYLVAATLRPETVYGQTNLWINPYAEYVRIEVDGEIWVLSKEAAEKIKYQKDDVILKGDVDIKAMIGQLALAPGAEREIMILPASFVDPKIGSGIVTCVPSHAPYDWIALEDIKKNSAECKRYRLNQKEVQAIYPIPLIKTKDWGVHPAEEICKKMNITSQTEVEKLEEAKREIYRAEHHTGIMLEISGKYSGKNVEEAKELVKAELIEKGQADLFHDLSEEVVCRCGSQVVIKRVDDQWFIKYSDQELTERSKEQAREMRIFPTEYHHNLPSVLDWFQDRACARLGTWLGSKFPFDETWTVEPISDSTLYPAYYIVSKYVNNSTISSQDLTEEFFDYVFLGKGEGKKEWKPIKEEFDYFYPLDMNLGGKEHQTVHFPVFLMNHIAILPEEKWPRGIFVNWWVIGKGSKISKSKGGAEPIPEAIAKYGVDAMRLYYAHIASPHVDVQWDEDVVLNYKQALERIFVVCQDLRKIANKEEAVIDRWLISMAHQQLKKIHTVMEKYDLRELASIAYFTFYDNFRWYSRRGGSNRQVIEEYISIWSRIMNPITPHLSEELNSDGKLSNGELASTQAWPQVVQEKIDHSAEAGEELVKSTLEGIRQVVKLAKVEKVKACTLFIAESWLYELFKILSSEIKITRDIGEIMRKVLEAEQMKLKGKEVTKIVQAIVKDVSKLPSHVTSAEDELNVMKEAKEFLAKEAGCEIKIVSAEDSTEAKAKQAWPGKVGILLE